jgi:hypothetical protein
VHAEHVLEPGVFLAQKIRRAGRAGPPGQRLVQRQRLECQFRLPGIADIGVADSQVAGQLLSAVAGLNLGDDLVRRF